jgi:hypothetical protein
MRSLTWEEQQYTTTNYTRVVTDERPLSTVTMRSTKHREPAAVKFYIIKFYGIEKDVLLIKVAAITWVNTLRLATALDFS